jgi:hypothetical protein
LRRRGIAVLTAQEDGATGLEDELLLRRAPKLDMVQVSHDAGFISEAIRIQMQQTDFTGIMHVKQEKLSIGAFIEELEVIALASTREKSRNKVLYF